MWRQVFNLPESNGKLKTCRHRTPENSGAHLRLVAARLTFPPAEGRETGKCQTFGGPSLTAPANIWPSGEKVRQQTVPVCPSSVASARPLADSYSVTVPFSSPAARVAPPPSP